MTEKTSASEKIIQSDSISFWTESFGDKKKPAIILIMGVAGQGIMWSDSFCTELSKDFFVIRYDHRDVGQSTHLNYMMNPYKLQDLSDDIIHILEGYSIDKAHLVGTSMGGYLAQLCMERSPDKVLSVTLIMSTVDFSSMSKAMMGTVAANDLPAPEADVLEGLKSIGMIDQSDFDSWLFKSLKVLKLFNGKDTLFDETEWVPLLEKSYLRRKTNVSSSLMHNHMMACAQGPMCYYHIKASCPVHVIHGSADPMLPIAHAKKTASHYNATLTIIQRMGHARPKIFDEEILSSMRHFYQSIAV
ncbi:MAG: alpha/beta fold hydrolase [Pseudomonadota bacterium]|jgi:pimeloyl-ACP methyl ester carboxylesterase|nr:alpha/beta fold hydrolase [Alphaproteobacteria bacterium]